MKLLILIACITVAFAAPQKMEGIHFGICVELCNRDDPLSCPAGMTCQSNGCGHTCQLAPQKRQMGICAEMCNRYDPLSCPAGTTCQSNGCGHTCQLAPQKRMSLDLGICAELCTKDSCPSGTSCQLNGCGHSCRPEIFTGISQPDKCLPELCDMYCRYGFATGKYRCPTCTCRHSPDFHILPVAL